MKSDWEALTGIDQKSRIETNLATGQENVLDGGTRRKECLKVQSETWFGAFRLRPITVLGDE